MHLNSLVQSRFGKLMTVEDLHPKPIKRNLVVGKSADGGLFTEYRVLVDHY